MEFKTLKVVEGHGGVGIIILNRPTKRNAISIEMRHEIMICLNNWKTFQGVGVVVFIGAGSAFSAGFDLGEFDKPELSGEFLESSSRYHREIWNFPKPTIAAVNGPAMAGGFVLATLCDIRICSESACFGHPEIKFGVNPIFTPLRWIVGDGIARDLCLTGRRIDSKEAHRIGLVSEIHSPDALLERSVQIGRTIAEAPPETIQYMKRCFIANTAQGFEESFRVEHDQAFKEFLQKK